jgi:hypothetical protein
VRRPLVLAITACSAREPLASCADDLRGVYRDGDQRWMVLDHGAALEAYPVFPDGSPAGGRPDEPIAAPRVIDLARGAAAGALAGTLHRRYELGAQACDAGVPVHVTSCAGDTLTLVLADPSAPLGFSPCTWPRPEPSRVVRWRRD